MSHDNKIKVKLTDDNLKQNQQEINEYLSYLKKTKRSNKNSCQTPLKMTSKTSLTL